jgi:DNA replication protein DnaC
LHQQRRFEARSRTAKLRHTASIENANYKAARGLDLAMFMRLASCDWIREHRHCLITGLTLCRQVVARLRPRRQGVPRKSVGPLPAPRGCSLARGDGRYARLMRQLARVDLLILDDRGPEPLTAERRRDLLEIVDDRYGRGSLIISSQVPIERWYEIVGDPTLADAILDRIIHNAHRIELKGESLRKQRPPA